MTSLKGDSVYHSQLYGFVFLCGGRGKAFPNPILRSAARSIVSFTASAARHGSATGSASSFVGGHASDCRRDPGSPSYVSRLARGERRSREIEGLLDREISMILASVMKRKAMVRKNVAKG